MSFKFEFIKKNKNSGARLGRITLKKGVIDTPQFMPVGTLATVKSLTKEDLESIGAQIILANTYHLFLRPGHDLIEEAGGLHKFMNWDKPILTDSGGFQVFSLAKLRKIDDEGVSFQSHIDGSALRLTPKKVIDIQKSLGSDIMMPLDECPPHDADYDYVKKSLDLTLRWAKISKDYKDSLNIEDSALFGIVQGGMFKDLREDSAKRLSEMDFPGYSIGGLSVGEEKNLMYDMAEVSAKNLPEDKPRYLMGVGTPEDLIECVERGIDMFDCVMPTRNARNGLLFTSKGKVSIKNAKYERDFTTLDENCGCYVCKNYTKSYLRHLYMSKEILSSRLNSMHNLYYYIKLMDGIREAIKNDSFLEFKENFYKNLNSN